jgi:hypothetical protein
MPTTLLGEAIVGTLLEHRELQRLRDFMPPCAETESIEERLADHEAVIDSIRRRFVELNRSYLADGAADQGKSEPFIGVLRTRAELAEMEDEELLRYGTILKYICVVEAKLLDLPLDESEALFHEARAEWHRRFGDSVISDSL